MGAELRRLFEEAVATVNTSPREGRAALERAMTAAGFPAHEVLQPGEEYAVPYTRRVVFRFAELDATQRAAVAFLVEHPELRLERYPLPGEHWALREWSGADAPSALFRPDADGRTPYEVLRALWASEPERHAYVERRPLRDRAEVLSGLSFLPADYAGGVANALARLVDVIDGSLGDWAAALARRILASREPLSAGDALSSTSSVVTLQRGAPLGYQRYDTFDLILPTYLALVRAGLAGDPAFDALLPLSPWVDLRLRRECIEAIPEARREAAIMSSLQNERFHERQVLGAQQLLYDYPYADLAAWVLAHAHETSRPSETLAEVREAGQKNPRIAELYAAHEQELGPVRELHAVSMEAWPRHESLDDAQREQVRALSRLWYQREETAPQMLTPHEDGPRELWLVRVFENGEPAFDAWLNEGQEGLIFRAGTAEHVAHRGQYGVECQDRALLTALRDALSWGRLGELREEA